MEDDTPEVIRLPPRPIINVPSVDQGAVEMEDDTPIHIPLSSLDQGAVRMEEDTPIHVPLSSLDQGAVRMEEDTPIHVPLSSLDQGAVRMEEDTPIHVPLSSLDQGAVEIHKGYDLHRDKQEKSIQEMYEHNKRIRQTRPGGRRPTGSIDTRVRPTAPAPQPVVRPPRRRRRQRPTGSVDTEPTKSQQMEVTTQPPVIGVVQPNIGPGPKTKKRKPQIGLQKPMTRKRKQTQMQHIRDMLKNVGFQDIGLAALKKVEPIMMPPMTVVAPPYRPPNKPLPPSPPRKPPTKPTKPTKPPTKPTKPPTKPLSHPTHGTWLYKPPQPVLHASTSSSSQRVPERKLHKSEKKESRPHPKKSPKKKRSPKRVKIIREVRGGRGGGGRGSDMRVAPTQQVTVAGGKGGADVSALSAKIDKLLKEQAEQKKKAVGKKAFTAAKKQYRAYRKKLVANLKTSNKIIKKKELARIRRLPHKERAAARQILKEQLKQRLQNITKKLPAKIQTPGHLREIMRS
jgi:hypothetical protein